jgi:hypothetical protein
VILKVKSLISQCFSDSAKRLSFSLAVLLCVAVPLRSQTQKPSLPDPIKFINRYDIVWNVVHWALTENMGFGIELEDKRGGRIVTKPYEFITGSLTASEVQKVAVRKDTVTGTWLRARYSAEVLLEIITPAETLVTVRTKIEALDRDMDGTEKWMPLDSLGVFEKNILGKISMKLLGSELQFDKKKGFWDKTPQPVDPRAPKPIRPPS